MAQHRLFNDAHGRYKIDCPVGSSHINVARLTIDFFFARIGTENQLENEVSDNCVTVGLPASEQKLNLPTRQNNFNDDKSVFRYSMVSSLNWNRKVRENFLSNE